MPRATCLTLLVLSLLTGCNSLSVRAPELNLPPLPAEVMAPCPEPDPVTPDRPDGGLSLAGTFLQWMRAEAVAGECRRRQAVLAQMVKYQEQVRAQYQQTLSNQSKPWYQFW